MKSKLDDWMGNQCNSLSELTREVIQQEQLHKVNQVLAYARSNSSFYGYLPKQIESLGEMENIPLITGEDIELYGHQMVCVSQSEIQRIVTMKTSGTTGRPKRVYFTQEDQEVTVEFFTCGLSEVVGKGDSMLILMPYEREGSIGQLVAQALERIGAKAILCGPQKTFKEMTDFIQFNQVNTIVGSPIQLISLARYMQNQKRLFPIERVLVSSDYLPQGYREILEPIWGCTVYNHYGSTESGLGFAVECEKHEGMHIREWDILAEIIDPETAEILPDGCWGELVFTTLSRKGMPLIRYRTGDRTRIIAHRCSCGSVIKSLDRIKGRIDSSKGKEELLHWLDSRLFTLPKLIDYQLSYDIVQQGYSMEVILVKDGGQQEVAWIRDQWKKGPSNIANLQIQLHQQLPERWKSLYLGKRKIMLS